MGLPSTSIFSAGYDFYFSNASYGNPRAYMINRQQYFCQPCVKMQPQGELPKARVAHSCSFDSVEGEIYLWGGFTGELSRLEDFYVYNCKSSTWRRLTTEGGEASPPARAFHSAVFHEGSLYLFSGANGDIRYNDVWRYQVIFKRRGRSIVIPPPRSVHLRCLCVKQSHCLIPQLVRSKRQRQQVYLGDG